MATRSLIDKQFHGTAKRAEEAQRRLDAKAKDSPDEILPAPGAKTKARLTPDRYPQKDFFIADIFDAAPKDDMASMEHPLFALKTGDMLVRKYERNGNSVEIKPGFDGCATIHDKDIWIYCISQLVEAINRGREDTNRTVRFTAYDFLVSTNRLTNGSSYERMADALRRLGRSSKGVCGRIESDLDADVRTPLMLVDGREISWEEFGEMLMTFEGWQSWPECKKTC